MASRSRSRSPLIDGDSDRGSPTPSHHSSVSNKSNNISQWKQQRFNTSKEYLKLCNIPLSWKWPNVSAYIKKHTHTDKAIAANITFISMRPSQVPNATTQDSVITFGSEIQRNQAFDLLRYTYDKVEGKKLFVHKISEAAALRHTSQTHNAFAFNRHVMHNPNDAFTMEDNDTYGLSLDYLAGLGIFPPLSRKVFVKYLPAQLNDEAKVRSIFSRAGLIDLLILVPSKNHTNVRIQYDHPVEAVQAVSMFNNREIYKKIISCEMDGMSHWNENNVAEGAGLGPNGIAMRGVRISVEIKKVRDEFRNICNRLHESVDNLQAQVTSLMHSANQGLNALTIPPPQPPAPVTPVATPAQNVNNPLAALGTLLTSQLQPMQLLQSLMQQNTGNDMSAMMGNALQNWTGSNLGDMLQQMQSQMPGGLNMQGGSNMPGGPNMQGGPNMTSGPNMQGGPNMTSGPNMQGGPNMTGGPNMQGGPNMAAGPNMQGGPNMAAGPNMQGGPNLQGGSNNMLNDPNNMPGGPSNNMASGPFNMQSGPANNMQSGAPNNMPRGPNVQSGNYNMQGGPSNMQAGPKNMHGGPQMQSGSQNMQSSAVQGQMNNPGFNSQQGMSNMQSGYSNIQHSDTGPNQHMNTGFGGPQFSNNTGRSDSAGPNTACMLLFVNLPASVTQQVLLSKMKEVGEVKLVEMTGPGRALVSYYSDFDSDKCLRLYNQSKVDGQTIEVRKV